jgi:hypothetical protein
MYVSTFSVHNFKFAQFSRKVVRWFDVQFCVFPFELNKLQYALTSQFDVGMKILSRFLTYCDDSRALSYTTASSLKDNVPAGN